MCHLQLMLKMLAENESLLDSMKSAALEIRNGDFSWDDYAKRNLEEYLDFGKVHVKLAMFETKLDKPCLYGNHTH